MKLFFKSLLLLVLVAGVFMGCRKGLKRPPQCFETPLSQEMPTMLAYANKVMTNPVVDTTGIVYEIVQPGEGEHPGLINVVKVNYVGKLLDGTQFDAGSNVSFYLGNLIIGWQIAVPKLRPGGKMKLVIPSTLAYGCSDYIPKLKSQILYFEIDYLGL